MKAASENTTRFDGGKWALVALLLAVAVGGNFYYSATLPLLYRVLGIVAITAFAALVALQTAHGVAFWSLAKAARMEIRKVVWPTRQETTHTTLIVVGAVLVMAVILWGLDALLGWATASLIG